MNTFASYLEVLLPALGYALQWRRAKSNIPEADTFKWAAIGAAACYVLCYDWTKLPSGPGQWQLALLEFAVWMVKAFPAVLGGTFIASKGAVYTGGRTAPITNSQ